MLGGTGGVIRLDCTTEDIILLSYPKLKEVPFTKPCTFIHEDEYGCIWVNPVEGELYFYDPMTRSLEQAYVYEKGVRVPHFRLSAILLIIIKICGIPLQEVN